MIHICITFCGCSMSLSKVMTRGVILHCPPKKSPKKPNQKWVKCCMKTPIKQVLLQTSLFIVQFSTRCLNIPSWTFFIKNQLKTDAFEAFGKSFQGFHQLALWAQRLDKGSCSKIFDKLYFCDLKDIWIEIFNDFLLYIVVIPKTLWIWPNAPFF